jgi:hypothetical protein
MSLMIEELYDALINAGANDDKARAAARAVARFDADIADLKSLLRLHSWMLGALIGLVVAVLFRQ